MNRTIVIYPGRFQPFGKHHYQTYKNIVDRFGEDNVYISTSDNIDKNSPLSFEEKSYIIQKFGINKNRIIQSDRPYMPLNLLNSFDKDTDKLFIVYGQKDSGRVAYTKKDGTPSYFKKYIGQHDLKPFKDSAYVIVAPHTSINHKGNEICGTYLRQVLSTGDRRDMFDLMGWSDEKAFTLFRTKFEPTKGSEFIKKALNTISESSITRTQLQRIEQYVDALFFRFGIDVDFKAMLTNNHFYQRLNDPRNVPEIAAEEIRQLFKKVSEKYGEVLSKANIGAEGVLKDMSSDINIPFIIKWDREAKELDLTPKTIMRKKDYRSSDPIYKVEQFKEVFNSSIFNQGKYTRHIMHPYESEMSISDLKRFILAVTKNTSEIERCTLKLDGYNLQVTYKSGQVLCSRNKSTVISPMSYNELLEKYKGNPSTQSVFCEAFKSIEAALIGVEKNRLNQIFDNGLTFISFEILKDTPLNVFKHDTPTISIHSLISYDSNGNESSRSHTMPPEILSFSGRVFNGFKIQNTPEVILRPTGDHQNFINKVHLLQNKYKIKESASLGSLPPQALTDLKKIIFELGNKVIKSNIDGADRLGNINRIVAIVDETGSSISNSIDLETFNNCMSVLNSLGGYKVINPIEGFVVYWEDKFFKLTGTFGLLVPIFNIWNKKRF